MKTAGLATLLLLLAGCSPGPEQGPSEAELNSARITQLEQKLAGLEVKADRQSAQLDQTVRQNAKDQSESAVDLKNRMASVEERETSVEAALRELKAEVVKLRESQAQAPVTAYAPPAPADDFITPPGEDLFPVRVFDVAGRKVVTGKHKSTQEVETGDTYRDQFGEKIAVMETTEVEVNEYGYQVVFSAENLTKTPKKLSAGAGTAEQNFALAAGETQTNLTVDSAVGADLSVTVAGQTRRWPVSYAGTP